ncbi:hypothetical protein [Salinicola halophilus]|uniref:hypothetical protein n=1 Tax=Salinicola halophilus TaxID=184065 RepID=UPI000DA235AE|nr:hypothetical protein [Salinicola halophilus]
MLATPPLQPLSFRAVAIRAVFYILALAALTQAAFVIDARRAGGPDFSEVSFTEITQALVLLASSLLMLYARQRQKVFPTAALLLWGLFFASFIRENDLWLDTYVFDGAWQVLATLTALPVLILTLRRRHQFLKEFHRLADTLGFGLFAGGFLVTYLFSRLYGRGELWHALMGEHYLRVVKDAAEEMTELTGYALMLFGCIEIVLLARRLQRRAALEPSTT